MYSCTSERVEFLQQFPKKYVSGKCPLNMICFYFPLIFTGMHSHFEYKLFRMYTDVSVN